MACAASGSGACRRLDGGVVLLFKPFFASFVLCTVLGSVAVKAEPPASAPARVTEGSTSNAAALKATTDKFNAYVSFMNRTLRASDSLDRYKSWVNMKTGRTGRERLIYGLYSVYDTASERAAATAELTAPPLLPDLDEAMRVYIAANDRLAPILNEANGYYDRADYKVDGMAGGKALHARIVEAAGPFLAARAHLDTVMRVQKAQLDLIRLATIEKSEGRKARWHVANVMMRAKQVLDGLPSGGNTNVDMPAFDDSLTQFGGAVKAMDDYAAQHAYFTRWWARISEDRGQ
jgi:hypothetical protein